MFRSFLWDFSSKFANQIISLVVSIFLTRLLQPNEFGVVAIALVVISFSTVFVDLGLGRAIIQAKEINETQLSTVFYINMAIAMFFAGVCILLAHPISIFYKQPLIQPVLQVLSISFVLGGLNIVQSSLLYRNLQFRKISIIAITSALISGIIGIALALNGYGVWSLVWQNIFSVLLTLILSGIAIKWKPKLIFDRISVTPLWRFSSKIFASSFLENIFVRLDIFLIGRLFSATTVGYYGRAQSVDIMVRQVSGSSFLSVLYPYLSKIQDNLARTREYFIRYLHIISFISFFLSGYLFVNAVSIFEILFSSKWLQAAYYFKIFTISEYVYPISALMVSVLSARGNSKAFLKLEIIKKLILSPVYLFGFWFGVEGFLYILSFVYLIGVTLNAWFVSKEIGVSIKEQWQIMLSYGICAIAASGASILISSFYVEQNSLTKIIFNSIIYVLIFLILNNYFRLEGFKDLKTKAKAVLKYA